MIKTRIVEAKVVEGRIEETDLGWVEFAEVPIEKRAPTPPPRNGELPPPPMTIKISGKPYWVIGHTWDLTLSSPKASGPMADSNATLVLIVQVMPEMPSNLVRADASALDQLERLLPPPGGRGN